MPIIDLGELNASFNVRVPVGTIVIWSGSVDNIPKGWHLCDGEDGTPDLRDKFVVGAGNEYQPEDQGGEKEVTLTTQQMPEHHHRLPLYDHNINATSGVADRIDVAEMVENTARKLSTDIYSQNNGGSKPHNNLPPYFALCYIMKLTADETDPGVGRSMEGQLVKPTSETEVTARSSAEIFNDYRERTFNSAGKATAGNVASGSYSHAEGINTTASGSYSHAEGYQTIASGNYSHAEGEQTTVLGAYSHAEGMSTTVSGAYSHAEGAYTTVPGNYSHAEGMSTTASGDRSHAEGMNTVASGTYSHAGCSNTIAHYGETAIGSYNVNSGLSDTSRPTIPNHFIVGKGVNGTRANAFRVADDGVYGTEAFKNSGADYAEMFEWEDGNPNKEDRVGRFVTLHGDKIRFATLDDNFILGVVSGNPSIVGDDHEDMWQGMYVRDVFGRHIFEEVSVPDELDSEGNVIVPAHTERREKINPNYDHTTKYIGRQNRPEWSAVGMLGKLVLVDDGSCEVDGWCKPGVDGIATKSQEQTKYRVISRLDDTHIKILII